MNGTTIGGVRALLRAEGAFVLMAAVVAYNRFGPGWSVFAIWFLAPDLAFLGYLAGPRIGALAYNATHSYAGSILLLSLGVLLAAPVLVSAGLIWAAHVGFDRALGYGLKYSSGFRDTHLGVIGRAKPHA